MIERNAVIAWQGKIWRVLAVDAPTQQAALIDLASTGYAVTTVPLSQVMNAQPADDPFASFPNWFSTEKQRTNAQHDYELIRGIVTDRSILFDAKRLSSAIVASGTALVQRKVRRLLNAYWRYGQTIYAIQSRKGCSTGPKSYTTKKPGRRSAQFPEGTPATDEVKTIFDKICRRYLLKSPPLSVPQAYAFFLNEWLDKPGTSKETAPTIHQFRYHFYKTFPSGRRVKASTSSITYEKDVRPLSGNIYDVCSGIGAFYEVDATVADVSLVSVRDRNLIVGRPILYVVTEPYSGMIVGLHVSLHNAQFISAADALYNAMAPKEMLFKKYGLDFEPEEWPCEGIPASICADNGELLLKEERLTDLVARVGINIEYTPPYRGDAKGTVEQMIRCIQHDLEPFLTGKPLKTRVKKAGGGNTSAESTATIADYARFAIRAVMSINRRVRENRPPGYPSNKPATPIEIWKWAQNEGRVYLQQTSDLSKHRRALLVHEQATISRRGLSLFGFKYGCARAADEGWFLRKQHALRPVAVEAAYDPFDITNILVKAKGESEWWPCTLTGDSRRFAGLSMTEAKALKNEENAADAIAEREFAAYRGEIFRVQASESQRIKNETFDADSGATAREKIKAIPENRRAERKLEHVGRIALPQNSAPDNVQAASGIDTLPEDEVTLENFIPDEMPELIEEIPD